MSEQSPSSNNEISQESSGKITRRRTLKVLAGAAFMIGGGLGVRELTQDNPKPTDADPLPEVPSVPTETPSNIESDSVGIAPLGSAEDYRIDYETKAPEEFMRQFNMTTKVAPTNSKIAEVFTNRVQEIAELGCNPTEVAPYLPNHAADDFISDKISKYSIAIAGLSGSENLEEATIQEVENSHLFTTISNLQKLVLEKYIEAAQNGSSDGMTFSINIINRTDTGTSDKGMYSMSIDLEAVIQTTGAEPIVLEGSMLLEFIVNPSPGVQRTDFDKVMEISLNKLKTSQFIEKKS